METLEKYANEIIPGLWLGSESAGTLPLEILQEHNIKAVVVVGKGLETPHTSNLSYLHLNVFDLPGFPLLPHYPETSDFINEHIKKGTVLVHCAQGVSRSPSVVIAYLMKYKQISRGEAEGITRKARKQISIHNFNPQLIIWEELNYSLEASNHTQNTGAFETYKKVFHKKSKVHVSHPQCNNNR